MKNYIFKVCKKDLLKKYFIKTKNSALYIENPKTINIYYIFIYYNIFKFSHFMEFLIIF